MDMTQMLGPGAPILQAPMAGEPATPGFLRAAVDAAVSGGLGAAYLEPDAIVACDAALGREDDPRLPYQINLFVPQPEPDERDRAGFEQALRAWQEADSG
jgi:nitronate monooxygenase